MRRHLATTVLGTAAGAVLLLGSACGDEPPGTGSELSSETEAACQEYTRVVNDWSRGYGTEMGAVGEAVAAGDDDRQEASVTAVRDLFLVSAEDLRKEADTTSDAGMAAGLVQAADGLVEIAEQIETYDDVVAAPDLMADGEFTQGGKKVTELCAGGS